MANTELVVHFKRSVTERTGIGCVSLQTEDRTVAQVAEVLLYVLREEKIDPADTYVEQPGDTVEAIERWRRGSDYEQKEEEV